MKQIIVATDFSKCSIHALEYAIKLSNTLKTNILLVWVDAERTEETVLSPGDNSRKEIVGLFDQLVEKYGPDLEHVEISYKIIVMKL